MEARTDVTVTITAPLSDWVLIAGDLRNGIYEHSQASIDLVKLIEGDE